MQKIKRNFIESSFKKEKSFKMNKKIKNDISINNTLTTDTPEPNIIEIGINEKRIKK